MMNLTPRINRIEKNLVIDGGMEIWPEGTSRSVANNTSAYGAVLFRLSNESSGITHTNSRSSSIPSNTNLIYSNQVSKTASGTLAAATAIGLEHQIEGYNLSSIFNDSFSVIFWVKSSVASNRSVSLRNGTTSHSYVKQYTISSANTWELKILSFDAMSTCPGTVDRTNGSGARLWFNIVAGSNFQTASLNQWVAGSRLSGISEDTTWLTGTNHDFSIAGVMVLPGDWTSLTSSGYDFIRAGRNFQDELSMTLRYFEKTYDFDTAPGTVVDQGAVRGQTIANGIFRVWCDFAVPKRVPTYSITFYNPQTGTAGQMRVSASNVAMGVAFFGQRNFSAENTASSANADAYFHWVVDARF